MYHTSTVLRIQFREVEISTQPMPYPLPNAVYILVGIVFVTDQGNLGMSVAY